MICFHFLIKIHHRVYPVGFVRPDGDTQFSIGAEADFPVTQVRNTLVDQQAYYDIQRVGYPVLATFSHEILRTFFPVVPQVTSLARFYRMAFC